MKSWTAATFGKCNAESVSRGATCTHLAKPPPAPSRRWPRNKARSGVSEKPPRSRRSHLSSSLHPMNVLFPSLPRTLLTLLLAGAFLTGRRPRRRPPPLRRSTRRSGSSPRATPRSATKGGSIRAIPPRSAWCGRAADFLEFDGDSLALRFDDVKDQVYFDAEIDGRLRGRRTPRGCPAQGAEFSRLGAGRHRLALFKRSEAAAGSARFRGAEIAAGAKTFPPAALRYRMTMEFLAIRSRPARATRTAPRTNGKTAARITAP